MLTAILYLVVGVLILLIDIVTVVHIFRQGEMGTGMKVLWLIVVLILPLIGPIVYAVVNKVPIMDVLNPMNITKVLSG